MWTPQNFICTINITATMWKTFVLFHSWEVDVCHNRECAQTSDPGWPCLFVTVEQVRKLSQKGSGESIEKQPWLPDCHMKGAILNSSVKVLQNSYFQEWIFMVIIVVENGPKLYLKKKKKSFSGVYNFLKNRVGWFTLSWVSYFVLPVAWHCD